MKTMSSSLIYNTLVKTPALLNSLKAISIDTDAVQLSALEDTITVINKKMNYPTKMGIVRMIQEGKVRIVYNPTKVKTPKYFDVFGKIHMGKPVYVINVGRYGRGSRESLTVNPRTMYALLQEALIYSTMMEKWEVISNNDIVKKAGCVAYSKLAAKILVKLFAIDNDPLKGDFIRFILAKFYLKNMADSKLHDDDIDMIAHKACLTSTTLNFVKNMESQLIVNEGEDMYANLGELFKALRQIKGLNSLTVRSFAENWARMYGEGSILAMDFLPSFLSMLCGVVVSGNLVKDAIVISICEKESLSVFNAISRTL